MSRSDLLLQLVQSGSKGDRPMFKKVVEAIIAEERSKQHNVLADKLEDNLNLLSNLAGNNQATFINGNMKTDTRVEGFVYEAMPRIRLSDLILTNIVENLCREIVQEQNRSDILRSYNLEPRHRVLFVGPPGNGKTSLAEAIASEMMVPFFSVKYENIIASYLGETSFRLKSMFDYIKTKECVLFFDEFDSISKERGDKHETGEIKRLVSSLLLQIDKLPSYVVVIAATNHPELLDRAVWRRFQVKVSLPKPTQKTIQQYLDNFQSQFEISFGYKTSYISKYLTGMSFSEVRDICLDIVRKFVLNRNGESSTDLKELTKQRLSQIKSSYRPGIKV
jgi:SpoVK/Ycf46/Vps4 family AAA+-type ATPase